MPGSSHRLCRSFRTIRPSRRTGAAWKFFESCDKQFLTAYGDSDPVTRGQETRFIENVPGAKDQKHRIIKGAGHFLQDDVGAALADVIVEFMRDNPAKDHAGA